MSPPLGLAVVGLALSVATACGESGHEAKPRAEAESAISGGATSEPAPSAPPLADAQPAIDDAAADSEPPRQTEASTLSASQTRWIRRVLRSSCTELMADSELRRSDEEHAIRALLLDTNGQRRDADLDRAAKATEKMSHCRKLRDPGIGDFPPHPRPPVVPPLDDRNLE